MFEKKQYSFRAYTDNLKQEIIDTKSFRFDMLAKAHADYLAKKHQKTIFVNLGNNELYMSPKMMPDV